jgi:hypothetical protein
VRIPDEISVLKPTTARKRERLGKVDMSDFLLPLKTLEPPVRNIWPSQVALSG